LFVIVQLNHPTCW